MAMRKKRKSKGELNYGRNQNKIWRISVAGIMLVTGVLIGFLLSTMKNGRITVLSNNTIGSKNGCGNSAEDMMIGARKNNKD